MATTYAIPNGAQYMAATLYTGNGSAVTVTNGAPGASFQPDFVWMKSRSNATDNTQWDSVRGATKYLISNATNAEATYAGGLTAFNTNGYSIGDGSAINTNAYTYVGWQWKAGGTAVSNTAGSITSSVSANPTAGFSVATFTCPASGNFTVGHGLGVTPAMIIVKDRSNANGWPVWHQSLGTPTQNYLALNTTSAVITGNTSIWANTAPTSSVVSFGTNICFNPSANAVMYAWAPIAGYSAFGSYTGNGSADGTFVYLGFRPKFVMTKKSSGTEDWAIIDSSRSSYNLQGADLYADLAIAEGTSGYDLLSNGIKFRSSGGSWNASGATYIYAAFAENPMKYANAR